MPRVQAVGPPLGWSMQPTRRRPWPSISRIRPSNPARSDASAAHGGPCQCACAGACVRATIAQQQGATLVTATVDALHQRAGTVEVRTDGGHTYRADKVLLATGGLCAKHLLPRPLEITVHARTIVLMELPAAEAVCAACPARDLQTADPAGPVTSSRLSGIPTALPRTEDRGIPTIPPVPRQRCRSGFAVWAVRAPYAT